MHVDTRDGDIMECPFCNTPFSYSSVENEITPCPDCRREASLDGIYIRFTVVR